VTVRNRWLAVTAVAVLALVAAVAAFLRFYDLGSNPGGLYADEAGEGLDALRLLHQPGFRADWMVWFQSDGGREALFAYAVAGAFHFFGETAVVLRATAAAFGVAGVLAIGHLGRRFGIWTGITAAAWAAGSLWLICISRDGMRNAIVPLFGAVALIALLHWASRPGRLSAVLAGGVTALAALYTYQPLKMLPVLVVVWLAWLYRSDRARFSELRSGVVPFAIAFLAVGAPMIAVAITEPANYFGRAASVTTFNTAVEADSSLPVHILRTLAMFGYTGDGNGRHDVYSLPLLPLPLTFLAALGVWRLWKARRDPSHSLILLSLPVFLIPPIVATEGYSPHFLRVLGLAAPLGVTIGLGAAELVEQVRNRWSRLAGRLAVAAVAVTLAAVAASSGWIYLDRPISDRYANYCYEIAAAGQYATDHPGSVVIIDAYSGTNIEFTYWSNPPSLLPPGSVISKPSAYKTIIAMTPADLATAVGPELAGRAKPVAWDPTGKPVVWAVTP
jgi:4-amino-4-deoxy-L-arabinose transferase-like glycosyltransferase